MAAITLVTILFFASGIAQQEMTLVPAEPETKQPATKPEPLEQAPERPSTAPKPTPKPIGRNVLDPDIGDWLVNLARHEGHLTGARNVRANSLHVLSLLRAAVHSAPNNADAWKFTYDLEYRMGREANAHEALERYSRLRPEDDKAAIDLIRLEIDKAQTADQRAKFAREELAKPRRSRPVQSELQYWLARYHFERGDLDNASTHISKSLLKNPLNMLLVLPALVTVGVIATATFGGDELRRVLSLADYNTRIVVLGTTLLGAAAGLIGTFTYLRKRAMVADALAHAMAVV